MFGRLLSFFGGLGLVQNLVIALVVLLFGAASLFYYQADVARERAAKFKIERDAAYQKVSEEQSKRRSLADAVIERDKQLKAIFQASEAEEIALMEKQRFQRQQSAISMKEADEQREQEGAKDEALFDTLGIR